MTRGIFVKRVVSAALYVKEHVSQDVQQSMMAHRFARQRFAIT